jgi:hypothetical protein
MAYTNFIPKIEYKKFSVTGDTTISTNVIDNIDTTNIEIGMILVNANFADEVTVTAVNATDIEVSDNATATSIGSLTTTFIRLEFRNPPQGDTLGQRIKHNGKTLTSRSGKQQTLTNFVEEELQIKFYLASQEEKDAFQNFLINWGYLGEDFSYFIDEGETTDERIVTLTPQGKSTRFKIQFRRGSGYNFRYEFSLKVRRVIA